MRYAEGLRLQSAVAFAFEDSQPQKGRAWFASAFAWRQMWQNSRHAIEPALWRTSCGCSAVVQPVAAAASHLHRLRRLRHRRHPLPQPPLLALRLGAPWRRLRVASLVHKLYLSSHSALEGVLL